MKTILKFITIAVTVIFILFLLIALGGCHGKARMILPEPGTQLMTKMIIQNNWLLTISILGIGTGFFAFLNGNSKGISIMASCFVVTSYILMVAKFATWIAIITMVGAIVLLVYTIWIRQRALKEVVAGGEEFKSNVPIDLKTNFNGSQYANQSKPTEKLVKSIKKKLIN